MSYSVVTVMRRVRKQLGSLMPRVLRRSETAGGSTTGVRTSSSSAELLVWPVLGELRVLAHGSYLTRSMTAEQLDDLAIRFHQAAKETRRQETAAGLERAEEGDCALRESGGAQRADGHMAGY